MNNNAPETRRPATQPGVVKLGIDVLEDMRFSPLQGKRVGLLTNPAGVNRKGESTIDVLRRAPEVNLVALFGPEHGIYGDEKANQPIDDRIDERTGLPVYSLYGKYRRPTASMLDQLDVLVVDLQDLGVRSYTYVSCMKYALEEVLKAGKTMVVLDRPNPLGGWKVDGPGLDPHLESYVGSFPVPYVHGLTIGELANMALQERWLAISPEEQKRGQLIIVPMQGWRRDMLWPQTGLRWVATSPAIPDLSAALGYAMTGLGAQLGGFSHGYGTRYPFRLLSFRGKAPEEVKAALERARIPGLRYRLVDGSRDSARSRIGVYVAVEDYAQLNPTELSFHMMQIACRWEGNPFAEATDAQALLFNKHMGSQAFFDALENQGQSIDLTHWLSQWKAEATAFQSKSRRYWLY